MENELTIIVCSCDKYSDLWYPYFEIFKHQWPYCKYPIILNTESKSYSHDGLKIKCLQLYKEGEEVPWSDRMIRTLQHVESKYVLVTLDDHFLITPVDVEGFENSLNIIKNNIHISQLSFIERVHENEKTKRIENFAKIGINRYFRINLDTAIWRKNRLLKCLKSGENAWEFELNGTERALWDLTEYYGYIVKAKPILDVTFHLRRGYGLIRGKWIWRNPELFKEFGIDFDFSIRGCMGYEECINYVESENKSNKEFDERVLYKNNKLRAFVFQAKRRIPVRVRLFLSKIKRSLPINWGD